MIEKRPLVTLVVLAVIVAGFFIWRAYFPANQSVEIQGTITEVDAANSQLTLTQRMLINDSEPTIETKTFTVMWDGATQIEQYENVFDVERNVTVPAEIIALEKDRNIVVAGKPTGENSVTAERIQILPLSIHGAQ